jgi:glycosyltransferase involved in cell wall biosynthesis
MQSHSIDKTKICFIAPKAYQLFNPDAKNVKYIFGGSEIDLYLLALELAKDKNFEVSFIAADYGQPEIEIIRNIKIIKSLDFNECSLKGSIKIWRAMKKADAQIYMLKTVSSGVPLVALFCLFHHRAFAYRTASQHECDGKYVKEHPMLGPAFKFSLRKAKFVFTQNATDKENLQRTLGVSSVFIRNGHYIEPLTEENRNTILWVGRSSPEKNPQLFVDLAKQLPNENFVMICPQAMDDNNYEQLTRNAAAVANLRFIQKVPYHQIGEYFRKAKVFVCTSRREGFPNTYIQACMNATPVLSLSINPDGFLDEYNCGICCNGNFDQMTDALRRLVTDNKYIELGKNARKYVEQNHDITKIVPQYKKAFMKIADNVQREP